MVEASRQYYAPPLALQTELLPFVCEQAPNFDPTAMHR
jgi:hypothetical protein